MQRRRKRWCAERGFRDERVTGRGIFRFDKSGADIIYNVNNFGAVADGQILNTKAVQKAVDACSAKGGGIVRFDGGRYVLSTVFLKSNVTIEIPEGAEILGAASYYDYAQEERVDYPIYQDSSHT